MINWEQVWKTIHNQFFMEDLKSTIWSQLHLNFYTTYNYNKWKNTLQPCPLCRKIPEDIFHIIFHCKFTKAMWIRIEKILLGIYPKPITQYEKALGLQPSTTKDEGPIILRNWITFTIRHYILLEERRAFHRRKPPVLRNCFVNFNLKLLNELKIKKLLYDFQGLSSKFENIVTTNKIVAIRTNGEYEWKDIL